MSGFTLIELVISLGIFVIIVIIAVGGFLQAIRTQRLIAAIVASQSNVSLTLEQMAREMRTGDDFQLPDPLDPTQITFQNARGETVTYRLNSADGTVERDQGSGFEPITAENVNVVNLGFVILSDPSYPPRVTITLGISPKEKAGASTVIHLQTTVSARI